MSVVSRSFVPSKYFIRPMISRGVTNLSISYIRAERKNTKMTITIASNEEQRSETLKVSLLEKTSE